MSIEIVLSDDIRFEHLSQGQNARFPETAHDRASRVALCDSTEDVAEVLERFVRAGLRPTVRSGGHCYEDFVDNNPGGAIIDLSLLSGTAPLPHGPKYRLGAGTKLGQAYPDLYKRDLVTIPGGTCPPVGAGGHISGGGYGLLSRLHGITPDWVSAVDIVTVDHAGKAKIVRADKRQNSDLLRACRGAGGGNFGIITNFYFDTLPKAPTEVLRGSVSFGWDGMTEERFERVLYLFSNYWETRGRDPETWGLFSIFNLSHRSSGHLGMSVNFTNPDGTVNDTRVVEEFLAMFDECKPVAQLSVHPAMAEHHPEPPPSGTNLCLAKHTLNKMAWIDANSGRSGGGRGGPIVNHRHKYKSTFMKKSFTPEEARCFYKHLTREIPGADLSSSTVLADSFGGAVNKKEKYEETSAAQRDSILKLQFISTWTDSAQDQGHAQWMRDFYTELYSIGKTGSKHAGTPFWGDQYQGCYINYPDADMLQYDFWPQLYYGTDDLYPFLQSVKRRYDPNNIFHHAMSVRV
ncbi:FAD-binding oxidoreductase [Edaphobacter sp. 12200R-103]|jgi:FAD/FMN-containing dehydrogenase|uniref:FAD-dependent oxidoreductase n=1 Tax=Edaphobacter sp. 12200R-103 TaxID=2703788 RepID=UPI00138CD427|nr:FAD-binding oxidoreductase [Edaphobacter sp. 12200R-103]QHS51402.1 FAD-binding oxidoreductase [Edaphobacter sp. 12200R-103]